MIVLCCGGESTGTRLLTRIVRHLGVGAVHRSVPYDRTVKGKPKWPMLHNIVFDRAIVMTRDWWAAAGSQVAASHAAHHDQAVHRLRRAYVQIAHDLDRVDRPWVQVSYESLVQRPEPVVANLADWLGVEYRGLPEPVVDGNTKWLGVLSRASSFSV